MRHWVGHAKPPAQQSGCWVGLARALCRPVLAWQFWKVRKQEGGGVCGCSGRRVHVLWRERSVPKTAHVFCFSRDGGANQPPALPRAALRMETRWETFRMAMAGGWRKLPAFLFHARCNRDPAPTTHRVLVCIQVHNILHRSLPGPFSSTCCCQQPPISTSPRTIARR